MVITHGGEHATFDVRPVFKYFVENMSFLKEMFNVEQPRPDFLPLLEKPATINDLLLFTLTTGDIELTFFLSL